ncbi:hypothetical protein SBRY_40692 [Actinacidiphila bryophytorum]|uniref:Uncharacterized protein n=1 Tax=Actinacidiphila bryophytorum TaxID=1436133 RepID=A0A9W4H3J9_9ACTN|nr:hypothetical protein SBRY_40692 [Actinacidiphila bryophytorum]
MARRAAVGADPERLTGRPPLYGQSAAPRALPQAAIVWCRAHQLRLYGQHLPVAVRRARHGRGTAPGGP